VLQKRLRGGPAFDNKKIDRYGRLDYFYCRGIAILSRGTGYRICRDNLYLAGDSAGLATLDMGEGTGPAIRSGFLAAESIMKEAVTSAVKIPKCSLLLPGLRWVIR
jgi:flavin-dependent dehydrogenase